MHLDKVSAFEERCKRFGDWADGVERRIGNGNGSGGEQVSPSRHGNFFCLVGWYNRHSCLEA